MKNDYKIQIVVKDENDEIICRREALTFESAGENLGKIESFIKELEEFEERENY